VVLVGSRFFRQALFESSHRVFAELGVTRAVSVAWTCSGTLSALYGLREDSAAAVPRLEGTQEKYRHICIDLPLIRRMRRRRIATDAWRSGRVDVGPRSCAVDLSGRWRTLRQFCGTQVTGVACSAGVFVNLIIMSQVTIYHFGSFQIRFDRL
jgi:hypothetical protein